MLEPTDEKKNQLNQISFSIKYEVFSATLLIC